MPLKHQESVHALRLLRQISTACGLALILIITLLTTTRIYAQTATLPPEINTFEIALQSTLADVDRFKLAPPYLYTIHDTTFTAYDISDPTAPVAINTMGLLSVTIRFEYSGTLAYILLEQSTPTAAVSNSELWILDLATPAGVISKTIYSMTAWNNNPSPYAGYPYHDGIVAIAPVDNYLLMSHRKGEDAGLFGTSGSSLTLLDLSTAPTPTIVSTATVIGGISDLQIYDNKYLIGRDTTFSSGPSGYGEEYKIFNYENILEPAYVDRYRITRPTATPLDLFAYESQTYLYTIEYPEQVAHATPCDSPIWTSFALRIRDITDPINPLHSGFYYEPGYPGKVTCDQLRPFQTFDGHGQFMAAAINDRLYLLDRTLPTEPFALGDIPITDEINTIQINDGLIVVETSAHTLEIFSYAEGQGQSRYLAESIDHQFFLEQMGFSVLKNSFTQPISFTVQTYEIDQTDPITESLYATHPLYHIATTDPDTGDEVIPSAPFSLEANYDSLNFGRPLDANILGQTLSFYRWEDGRWQKVPSTVVNGETPYPTVSAQVDQSGSYTVLAQRARLLYLPMLER